MTRIAVLILLAAQSLLAQDDAFVRRVFQLKYAEPQRMRNMLQGAKGISFDDQMKTLAVEALKYRMDEFEQIIKRLDVPPPPVPNIEVTIFIMSTLAQSSATALPTELDGVVKQLKSMFSYKSYQLIDTQVIRVRDGHGGETSGVVNSSFKEEFKTVSRIKFRAASSSTDEKGTAIRVDALSVGLRIPIVSIATVSLKKEVSYLETGINTDVDLHEGQKVVVGKANMDGTDRASIVVLTAKVVD